VKLTEKQEQVLATIVKGNEDGSFCDLDEVIEKVPYDTTKASIQFIIRNLKNKGLIYKRPTEKRRGRRRVVLGPTSQGFLELTKRRLDRSQDIPEVDFDADDFESPEIGEFGDSVLT